MTAGRLLGRWRRVDQGDGEQDRCEQEEGGNDEEDGDARVERPAALAADREPEQVDYAFDLLLCAADGEIDWESLLMTLKKKGRLVLVGFPQVSIQPTDLVAHQLSITGSFLGNRVTMLEMLAFAQEHGIVPVVELLPMSAVNEAIQRQKETRVRYRVVLVNDASAAAT